MFKFLETITPAAGEPVTLERAKQHLRVTFANDDAYIADLIETARVSAENWLQRPIRAASYQANFDVFSTPFVISGLGPVSVTAVDFINAAAQREVVPASQYSSGHGHQGQIICPVDAWPIKDSQGWLLFSKPLPRIAFDAGFATVPAPIRSAILLQVQNLYDQRGSQVLTNQKFEDSQAWQNLLWPYRIVGI